MRRHSRMFLVAASAFLAFNVFLAGSKMGILGLAGGAVLMGGLYVLRPRPPAALRWFASWLFVVGAAYLLVEITDISHVSSYALSDDSYHTRTTMWHISWLAFLEAPLSATDWEIFRRFTMMRLRVLHRHWAMPLPTIRQTRIIWSFYYWWKPA